MASADLEKERFCASAWPKLVGALTHYCGGDVHLAEELVQEALVRACRRWRRVSTLESPVGWTYRVAVNLANSTFRRRRAERRAHDRHGEVDGPSEQVDTADRVAVRQSLGQLTSKQREAVILRYFLDVSVREAAELMDSTPGAVRGLTHGAVVRLREAFDVSVPSADEESVDVS